MQCKQEKRALKTVVWLASIYWLSKHTIGQDVQYNPRENITDEYRKTYTNTILEATNIKSE